MLWTLLVDASGRSEERAVVWLRRTGCASRRKKPPVTHIRGLVITPSWSSPTTFNNCGSESPRLTLSY